jgi:dihydroorotate dehydrogenase
MTYRFIRPLLFKLDPEAAHGLALTWLDRAAALGLLSTRGEVGPPHVLMGLNFPNRVGLAAGLDKNGDHIDAFAKLGFGFIEIGTVTPRPQPGNPRPRLFRLPAAQALINRMGFNNLGVDHLVGRVGKTRYQGVLGINIGKNFDTPIEQAAQDYLACLRKVYPHASYVTINISSPNTKNLRALQRHTQLSDLLGELKSEQGVLAKRHARRVPLAIKIAPDLDDEQLEQIAELLLHYGIEAVIATNTTVSRDQVATLPYASEAGGLSGEPLRERSTAVIQKLSRRLAGRVTIIGVGGIACGAHALEKLQAGADLVQLYTGLIYRGPALVRECRFALRDAPGSR